MSTTDHEGRNGPGRNYASLDDCEAEVAHLRAAMASRPVIDQAKGMLMATHGIGPDDAFAKLKDASMRSNRKLHDIAEAMVEGAAPPTGAEPA